MLFIFIYFLLCSVPAQKVYWLTLLNAGSSPVTMQSVNYNGENIDVNFFTIENVNLNVPDMVLYDGYFYVTALTVGLCRKFLKYKK